MDGSTIQDELITLLVRNCICAHAGVCMHACVCQHLSIYAHAHLHAHTCLRMCTCACGHACCHTAHKQTGIHYTHILLYFLTFHFQNLADNKTLFGEDSVRSHANTLVQDALANTDNILRCAAGEALGRVAQVVSDTSYLATIAQTSFEKCQKNSDAVIRTGHALALGCLHRYVGGMGSGHHLSNSVSILIALAKDPSSALVQV